jgi:fructose 5-dehydrogenase small subunit
MKLWISNLPPNKSDGDVRTFVRSVDSISRRTMLKTLAIAAQLAFLSPVAARAQPQVREADFLALSRALTGRGSMNATFGGRLYAALVANNNNFADRAAKLVGLMQVGQTSQQLLARASEAGLRETAHVIVAGWYTGTVTHDNRSQLIAYDDALMYSTVSDGLTVPTYCSNGPLWWSKVPPAAGVLTPAEAAKARLSPAPAPVTNKHA